MGWGEAPLFLLSHCFCTVTTPKKTNANTKGIIKKKEKEKKKKEVRVGEVPAKHSLTNMCMFKQGD